MNRRNAIRKSAALTGAAISTTALATFLTTGCEPGGALDWTPVWLSAEEAELITKVSDLMLPPTESPGALDVHVPEFVDLMVKDCLPTDEQTAFRSALSEINESLSEGAGRSFLKVSTSDQAQALTKLDQAAFKDPGSMKGYRLLKQLILLGYFTSQKVMTSQLNYHAIAGRYEGCIPYDSKGNYVDNNVSGRL